MTSLNKEALHGASPARSNWSFAGVGGLEVGHRMETTGVAVGVVTINFIGQKEFFEKAIRNDVFNAAASMRLSERGASHGRNKACRISQYDQVMYKLNYNIIGKLTNI